MSGDAKGVNSDDVKDDENGEMLMNVTEMNDENAMSETVNDENAKKNGAKKSVKNGAKKSVNVNESANVKHSMPH